MRWEGGLGGEQLFASLACGPPGNTRASTKRVGRHLIWADQPLQRLPSQLPLPVQPPYLNKGARPSILGAPVSTFTGQQITVSYSHSNAANDPVTRAILIRTGSATHSQAFGECRTAAGAASTSKSVAISLWRRVAVAAAPRL